MKILRIKLTKEVVFPDIMGAAEFRLPPGIELEVVDRDGAWYTGFGFVPKEKAEVIKEIP